MTSLKTTLKLEQLHDRITPAVYTTATDQSDWAAFSTYSVDMADKPSIGSTVAAAHSAGPTATPAPFPFATPAPAWTIDDAKAQLGKNPDAKAILDAAIKDGVTIVLTDDPNFGGRYNPVTKTLRISSDAKQNPDVNIATTTLLYELLRYKYSQEQLDLDKQAKAGTLTKDEYATKCEELTYKYMKEHHDIAAKGVTANQWPAATDEYKNSLAGSYSTFEKYLADPKKNGHYQVFLNRYDSVKQTPSPE